MADTYITKDTGEAAYIVASGIQVDNLIRPDDIDIVFFRFRQPILCKELASEYHRDMGNIPPKRLIKSYKYLIRKINEKPAVKPDLT